MLKPKEPEVIIVKSTRMETTINNKLVKFEGDSLDRIHKISLSHAKKIYDDLVQRSKA